MLRIAVSWCARVQFLVLSNFFGSFFFTKKTVRQRLALLPRVGSAVSHGFALLAPWDDPPDDP